MFFDKTVVTPLVSRRSVVHTRTGVQGQQPKAQLKLLNPKEGTSLCHLAHAKALWTGSGLLVTKTASPGCAAATAPCSPFWAFDC